MRPNNLRSPFITQDRRVLIDDRILFVPNNGNNLHDFQFPGWGHPDVFGCEKPVNIEYCSGNGLWISQRAKIEKECHWVAIEKKFVRIKKIWSKIKNDLISNLFCICGEGFASTKSYIPSDSISEIFINFPDPWPKRHHAKFRLIKPPFIQEIFRILKKNGTVTIVTDDVKYSDEIIKLMNHSHLFISHYQAPYYSIELASYGTSYFEELWRSQQKEIRYHIFQKK